MKLSDLQNLSGKPVGSWPAPIKGLLIFVICAAVLGLGFYFDTQGQMERLERVEREEQKLRDQFERNQRKAANLEPLKDQLAQMEESFGALLRLLPNKQEIEGLLVDISQSGLASGLEFELFRPEAEQKQEFYAIQPIKLRVTGSYHRFGEFISAVAALPRIVTQHDILIRPAKSDGNPTALAMEATAKTYRYLDDEETSQIEQEKKKSKNKKRKRKR